jgi:hypothetical protein
MTSGFRPPSSGEMMGAAASRMLTKDPQPSGQRGNRAGDTGEEPATTNLRRPPLPRIAMTRRRRVEDGQSRRTADHSSIRCSDDEPPR